MKKKSVSMGIGVVSLLMMFIILCMIILSVLSYQDSKQSEALATREQQMLEAYYEAEAQASILYAKIQKQTGDDLETIAGNLITLTEKESENITIDVENDILNIMIKMNENMNFHASFNQQLEIITWEARKEVNE